jgi:hypothetical protein
LDTVSAVYTVRGGGVFGWGTGLMSIRVDDADSGTGNGKSEIRGSFAALQDDDVKRLCALG